MDNRWFSSHRRTHTRVTSLSLLPSPYLIRLRDIIIRPVLGALRANDGNRNRESPSLPAAYRRMTPLSILFVNGNVHQSNTPRAKKALCSDHPMCE